LIFDQTTARLLGEVYYGKSGAVTEWADYLQQKVVNSVPDYPAVAGVANSGSSVGTSSDQSTDTTLQALSTTTTPTGGGPASTPTQTTSTTSN